MHAMVVLHLLHHLLERIVLVFVPLLHAHDDVAVHLDETPIGVVGKPAVAGRFLEAHDSRVIQAEVEDRVHHARHAVAGSGPHAHQQGVGRIAELFARFLLHQRHEFGHFRFQSLGKLFAGGVVVDADLGGDREAGGHGEADFGHLGQIGPLAAEEFLHRAIAVAALHPEVVDHPSRLGASRHLLRRLLAGRLLSEGVGHGRIETFPKRGAVGEGVVERKTRQNLRSRRGPRQRDIWLGGSGLPDPQNARDPATVV